MSFVENAIHCIPSTLRTVFHVEGKSDGLMSRYMTVVLLLLSLFAISMNLGVVTRIVKLRKRVCDYKPAFVLIGNLAVSDFLVGFFVLITFCLDLSEFSTNWKDKCCGFYTAISVIACQETIFTIVLIAIDKYIYICHGLAYSRIVTKQRTYAMLSTSWCYSILIAFSPAIGLRETVWCSCNFHEYISKGFAILLFITSVIIPLAVMGSLYSVILSLAIKLSKSRVVFSSKTKKKSNFIRLSFLSRSSKSSRTRTTFVTMSPSSSSIHSNNNINRLGEDIVPITFSGPLSDIKSKKANDESQSATSDNHEIDSIVDENEINQAKLVASSENISENAQMDNCLHNNIENVETIRSLSSSTYSESNQNIECDESSFISLDQHTNAHDMTPDEARLQISDEEAQSLTQESTGDQLNTTESCQIGNESENPTIAEVKIKRKNYLKSILREARTKAGFLTRIKAIKTVFLIIASFSFTYVPFIIGTLIYKSQSEKNANLYQSLNNLLYCAVVGNSVINPFIYAYGYKEFRLRTKQFKGIFARERTPKI